MSCSSSFRSSGARSPAFRSPTPCAASPVSRWLPLCAALSTLSPAAWAETLPTELPAVKVTARQDAGTTTLTQPDLPTARARIERTAGGVGIVDAASYTDGRVAHLADALGGATGVFVQPRFGAEESRLSIRGSGLQRTFHGRGLKLMQDGVPLNLADGSFDFQAIEPLSARYIEVWRGANALQYGSATLGGAVNFVSPNGRNAERFRARGEVGSFGYRRAHVAAGHANETTDAYVSASVFRQHGFRDHAQQNSRRLSANVGHRLTPELETRVYLGVVDSDSELPGSITRQQLEANPRQANVGTVAADQRRDIRWARLSNKTVYADGPQRVEFFAYVSDKHLHHPIFQVLDQDNRDVGAEVRYQRDDMLAGRRNRFTVGFAPSRGVTDENRFANVAGNAGARTNASRQTARNLDAYAEDEFMLRADTAVIAGLQHNRSTRRLQDRFIAGTATDPVDEGFDLRYSGWNPKLGVRHDLTPEVQLFANLSRSFEPPSFSELAGGMRPTLNRAQRADTFEIGSRGHLGADAQALTWDMAFYESRMRDELLQIATNVLGASVTVNAPNTLHRGVELGLSGRGLRSGTGQVVWRLNALWNRFRFRDDPTYGNGALPGVPKQFARAQLGYRWTGGTSLSLQLEGASGYPIDFAQSFGAAGYGLWGLKGNGPVTRGLDWFVDARNLSNRRYAATTGVVRNAGGLDSAQFMPGDGRSVAVGLDWKLN